MVHPEPEVCPTREDQIPSLSWVEATPYWCESSATLPLHLPPSGPLVSKTVWAWGSEILLQHLSPQGSDTTPAVQWDPHIFIPCPSTPAHGLSWGCWPPNLSDLQNSLNPCFLRQNPCYIKQQKFLRHLLPWLIVLSVSSLQGDWNPSERIFIYLRLWELLLLVRFFLLLLNGHCSVMFNHCSVMNIRSWLWSQNSILGPTLISCSKRSLMRGEWAFHFSQWDRKQQGPAPEVSTWRSTPSLGEIFEVQQSKVWYQWQGRSWKPQSSV